MILFDSRPLSRGPFQVGATAAAGGDGPHLILATPTCLQTFVPRLDVLRTCDGIRIDIYETFSILVMSIRLKAVFGEPPDWEPFS